MNILLAFKAEPDAGMLAEKEWQAAAQGKSGPDISLLRSLLGADEQAAAALLLAQRKNGTPMSLTALSMGDEADNQEIAMLAEKLGAEVGYSRARVMNGGVDAEKVIGISGHLLAPEVCIVVGASGAAALMAGVRNSKFVVAINHDASAAVFSQADVGVVDDWKVVLEALVTNIHADCQ